MSKISVLLVATNTENRISHLQYLIDKLNTYSFDDYILSIDYLSESEIDLDNTDNWRILRHKKKGLPLNQYYGATACESDILLYCEDDIIINEIPQICNISSAFDTIYNGKTLGFISLVGGGYEITKENENEMKSHLSEDSSYIIRIDSDIFISEMKNSKINGG